MYTLYGDGIHDDTLAIQELIDRSGNELVLPSPKKHYLISQTLTLPSNFRLVLPRFAEIRLADNSNCVMLRNRSTPLPTPKDAKDEWDFYFFLKDFDGAKPDCNIEVTGGIWNCNNMGQLPNPAQVESSRVGPFTGYAMLFYSVKNLKISGMTFKDPTNYAVMMDRVSYFTVEDITFDYNDGNPYSINMDGIHLDGNCHYGVIRNLKGACRDDLVALNAEEGSAGPITDIEIDGLFAEECHSAVRLLTVHYPLERIHISNVFGTYYQYCIGITKYYPGVTDGGYDMISIDHVYASKAIRHPHLYPWPNSRVYAPLWISHDTVVKNLHVSHLHRREENNPIPTVHVGKNTSIQRLILDDVTTENRTGSPMPLLHNEGSIRLLSLRHVYAEGDEVIENLGSIEEICKQ